MEEKQKVQVVFEFDRSEYDAYLFLMNQKKTKEVEQIWNTMSGEPVVADIDLFFEFLPIALIRQFVEQCIEPGEIGYFLCHIILSLFSPLKELPNLSS